ncbi:MAG TPA: SEFIR domain-containing protein [Pyrinomonadaceae bacterium]|nr:SEFIR domain-containing protein [Pyrinomonadaceae bacterium]
MPTTDAVFISYSHDSPEHKARVLALADRLRAEGVGAVIDQYLSVPPEGWHLWTEKQIRDAGFVIVVCTETYHRRVMKEEQPGRGLGAAWEASIIYSHLYEGAGVNTKFIPVVFGGGDMKFVPKPLGHTPCYDLGAEGGYDLLYRRLTGQHATPAGPLGPRRPLPPPARPASPAAPRPAERPANLVHPYPLEANFTGRVEEREALSAWLADDAPHVCALVAIGGMGKSALAWYWLQNDVFGAGRGGAAVEGVMWWSFSEAESSIARFVDEALGYVGGGPFDAALLPSAYDRTRELLRLLQESRVLFVLDGFERQLRAYTGSAATSSAGSEEEEEEADDRACVEPEAARLLRHVASGATRAKLLITTRQMARELEDQAGAPLAGVLRRDLRELPRDDAVRFMRGQGVTKGTPAEIADACDDYGYHPLSLRLLSGLIARDPRTPGDIAAAPRYAESRALVRSRDHILEQSYEALADKGGALLSRAAAFRGPTDYDALALFNEYGDEADFAAALDDLVARGLVRRDTSRNSFDLHPVVRRYAYGRLADRTAVHARLRDHYAKSRPPSMQSVRSIEDLLPGIELFHHTLLSGRPVDAARLYDNWLHRPLYYKLGAYHTVIDLMNALRAEGTDGRPQPTDGVKALATNVLGNTYSLVGRPRLAAQYFKENLTITEGWGDGLRVAMSLLTKGTMEPLLGELAGAESDLRRGIELSQGRGSYEAIGRLELGRVLAYRGAFDEAAVELDLAAGLFRTPQFIGGTWAYRSLRALLVGDFPAAREAAGEALRLADVDKLEIDFVRARWLAGAALVSAREELAAAAEHLADALTRCRRNSLAEFEPDILLALARWHHARGAAPEAGEHAAEALSIADRCEYRLKQADVHNFLARLAHEAGDLGGARRHAEAARERAWCDGPPHCYQAALDAAEATLREL